MSLEKGNITITMNESIIDKMEIIRYRNFISDVYNALKSANNMSDFYKVKLILEKFIQCEDYHKVSEVETIGLSEKKTKGSKQKSKKSMKQSKGTDGGMNTKRL